MQELPKKQGLCKGKESFYWQLLSVLEFPPAAEPLSLQCQKIKMLFYSLQTLLLHSPLWCLYFSKLNFSITIKIELSHEYYWSATMKISNLKEREPHTHLEKLIFLYIYTHTRICKAFLKFSYHQYKWNQSHHMWNYWLLRNKTM